jgi:DNA-binding transcriptional LysR family regulator
MREYFDDELLIPVGRNLTLTPLAQTLVEPVRDILLKARATIARKPHFDPATAVRRFSVCASDYVTTVILAEGVRRLAELAPSISVDIRMPPSHVATVFDQGGIDLLVMPRQYTMELSHPCKLWFEDEHVCMVCAGNQLVGESLTFEQYMAMGHIAVQLSNERSNSFEQWFVPRYGQQRRIESSVDNFSTLPLLVVGTQRIATLHRRMAEHFARLLPLRLLQTPFEMPPLQEMICWPRHLDNDPAHHWLRESLLTASQTTA